MIKEKVVEILKTLPPQVELVAAAKGRTLAQVEEAIVAGAKIIGENYVKEAEEKFSVIGNRVKWHLIGHLQKNKTKIAAKIFDMIETLDSMALAEALDKECKKINRIMPVLIEVNSAKELQKSGVLPADVEGFVKEALRFNNLKLMGLMTMGPLLAEPEKIRPFFVATRKIFDTMREIYRDKAEFRYLSMGMSDTYKIAIEEGANLIRVGTAIFGPR
jgi:hypothetical protein